MTAAIFRFFFYFST
ncbi:pheST operon leader peptide PheM [Escherichia coli]|uniref:pheST attenuator peptide n=1 Tax=Enterobacter wuhouensis TaxID=2529381 RepID=A0ABZ1DP53_9ENTR|nr:MULTISPECIES: pheST operon leader peptide PheM [Enterobacteriaceae]EIQ0261888.1 pheST operon leader peptide PheM [Escherichia coli]EKJ2213088.1 pheST operon leader peptide PheM [Escherichia coli]MCV2531829.1 pheST operon leader peptide PheM [Enterobacter wuhouensis]MCW3262787.1 pheST operon leader peptide PheM [Escherichia coli]WRW33766.1 pheST operon leader peptide PheM [Enterobacter wuhouensis]